MTGARLDSSCRSASAARSSPGICADGGAGRDRGHRVGSTTAGAHGGPDDATCAPLVLARRHPPPGRLLLGVLPGLARPHQPGGRDGPVPRGGRSHAERQDHEPGRAGDSGLARTRRGRQREERPAPPHAGDAGPPRPGVVHRPHRQHRGTGEHLVAAHPLRRMARGHAGSRPTCARPPRGKAPRQTASSGTPRRRSSWLRCFVAAALDRRTMTDVVRWVDTQEAGRGGRHPRAGRTARGAARGGGNLVP